MRVVDRTSRTDQNLRHQLQPDTRQHFISTLQWFCVITTNQQQL